MEWNLLFLTSGTCLLARFVVENIELCLPLVLWSIYIYTIDTYNKIALKCSGSHATAQRAELYISP